MAEHTHTTGAGARPPAPRYVKAARPVPTTITRPGRTARSRDTVIEGQILGQMMLGTTVHHYRVAGADGVIYLCPPHWLSVRPVPAPETAAARERELTRRLGLIWERVQIQRSGVTP